MQSMQSWCHAMWHANDKDESSHLMLPTYSSFYDTDDVLARFWMFKHIILFFRNILMCCVDFLNLFFRYVDQFSRCLYVEYKKSGIDVQCQVYVIRFVHLQHYFAFYCKPEFICFLFSSWYLSYDLPHGSCIGFLWCLDFNEEVSSSCPV